MENNVNKVKLTGKLLSLKTVWSSLTQTIYEGIIEIIRDSGTIDQIPVLFNNVDLKVNSFISVDG